MKKVIILCIIVTSLLLGSCNASDEDEKFKQEVLGGKHELKKFNVKNTITQSSETAFFLVMGSYSSHTIKETKVRFYFLNYKKEYQFMEKPLKDVLIKIDSTAKTPYVEFRWSGSMIGKDYIYMYDWCVDKVIVHCKESDFKTDININDLK